jgi:two-component system, LytTR family, sensor kinase
MKSYIRYTMREHARKLFIAILIGGLLGFLFFTYLQFSETEKLPSFSATGVAEILASVFIGSILSIALYFFNKQLDRWIPWRKFFAGRFLTGYFTNLLLAMVISVGLSLLFMTILGEEVLWKGLSREDEDLLMKIAILMLSSLFVYHVVYALLYSYQHYAVAQIESLQAERKQLELQFEALKSQISPHYLFNSLNTISSLIFKDLPSAEQFIRRLAQTYQYILSTQDKKYVLLSEEVDFVQSYYYLLRIRFQQHLQVEINLPSNIMASKIPPLTLQMLVENAVKHNSFNSDQKLFIYITAQDNTYLKVINTKTGATDQVASFKVGLENIRKRYQYFTDKRIEVRDEEKFSVSLPVIHSRHEIAEQKYSA